MSEGQFDPRASGGVGRYIAGDSRDIPLTAHYPPKACTECRAPGCSRVPNANAVLGDKSLVEKPRYQCLNAIVVCAAECGDDNALPVDHEHAWERFDLITPTPSPCSFRRPLRGFTRIGLVKEDAERCAHAIATVDTTRIMILDSLVANVAE